MFLTFSNSFPYPSIGLRLSKSQICFNFKGFDKSIFFGSPGQDPLEFGIAGTKFSSEEQIFSHFKTFAQRIYIIRTVSS
jgi:hypothetical protein